MTTEPNYGIRARELIRRLIAEGPDRIAFHVYRRVVADRVCTGTSLSTDALSWPEIAEWAQLEGLLDQEQARRLRHEPRLTSAGGDETGGEARSGIGQPLNGLVGKNMDSKGAPNTRPDAAGKERTTP